MSQYTSSAISKYGDIDNVKRDVTTLRDILNRQGTALLIDVIAEAAGETAIRCRLNDTDRTRLMQSLNYELANALAERL